MRLHLDEDLPWRLARLLRRERFDVTSSQESGRNGLSDEEQLLLAAHEGRAVVTRNAGDYAVLTGRFFAGQRAHAGVLLVPPSIENRQLGRLAKAVAAYVVGQPEGMGPYAVDWLREPTR